MPSLVSQIIVLAEDREQQRFVGEFVRCVSLRAYRRIRNVALPAGKKCGSQYVREQFPSEVRACRSVLGRKCSCILVCLTDADNLTFEARQQTLTRTISSSKASGLSARDPIFIMIPKWQIETWIKILCGLEINEDDKSSDQPSATSAQIIEAANRIKHLVSLPSEWQNIRNLSLKKCIPRFRRVASAIKSGVVGKSSPN